MKDYSQDYSKHKGSAIQILRTHGLALFITQHKNIRRGAGPAHTGFPPLSVYTDANTDATSM